jgi:hypothetical protein
MKKILLLVLVVMIGLPMFGQEVRFPAAIVSAGSSPNGSAISQSRWRLAPVHVITLNDDEKVKSGLKGQPTPQEDWNVFIYPNPVKDFLYLEFEVPEKEELFLKITDISGRIVFIQETRPYLDGSTDEIDLSRYSPALYLLQISSPDHSKQKVYRIQKI